VCAARGLRLPGRPRPARPTTARRSAAHAGAVTAPRHTLQCGRRRRHSGRGGANGGGRAPTTVKLPAGHGGGGDSSPELLVDGEGEKTGSAAAFFRRGGATVVGGGPATVRREGKVSSALHGRRTARGELGRRSPWTKLATVSDGRTAVGFGHGGGAASDSGDGAVGTRRGEAVRTAAGARSERHGAVGTPVRGPDGAFNARAQHGVWQPRGNGALPGGPGTDSGV
jgi:hypothetical protein